MQFWLLLQELYWRRRRTDSPGCFLGWKISVVNRQGEAGFAFLGVEEAEGRPDRYVQHFEGQ